MQRLFSMFPTGGPGVALLLLRAAVALALTRALPAGGSAPSWIAATAAALLLGGVATPIVAAMAVLLLVDVATSAPTLAPGGFAMALSAAALALLGPGAYSLDAWRFGRRVVTPRSPTTSE